MSDQLKMAKTRLFSEDGLNVSNIKLFPGTNRDTSPEEMAEEINRALSQLEAGETEEVLFAD